MSRYVDADEVKDAMLFGMCGTGYQTQALLLIEEVPTADVVEVVRCKECKYYKEYISHRGSAMMCFCPCCIGGQGKKKPTDYCSYGERKDNECE